MTDQLIRNDQIVQSLSQAIARGMASIPAVPGLLRSVLEKDMWRERVVRQTGEIARFNTFEEFVTSHPPEGLGTTVKVLESICNEHNGADVLPRLRAAKSAAGPVGRPPEGQNNVLRCFKGHNDTADGKLARLKRDRPDLAQAVIDGELSAHAAAVEAGFANPKVSINLRDLSSAARTIWRKLDRSEVMELIDWLYKLESEFDKPPED
jgi:hypothetical protein